MNFSFVADSKLKFLTLIYFFIVNSTLYSQDVLYSSIVFQGTEIDVPVSNQRSLNGNINDLLSNFNVQSYSIAYPVAKTKRARECFRIVLNSDTPGIDYPLVANNLKGMGYVEVLVEQSEDNVALEQTESDNVNCNNPEVVNDPCVSGDPGHYITNSNLPCAWAITHGDPNIVVAVVDQYLDFTHDDLFGKITNIWTPVPNPFSVCNHGFTVTGSIVAIPNNNFCVAGAGYDSKAAFYAFGEASNCGSGTYIDDALLQAYADGHKIINLSLRTFGSISTSMIEEIVKSGVTLVHGTKGNAHNGYGGIPGIIGIGQVDKDLNYKEYTTGVFDQNVDIYAPCLDVCRLERDNGCQNGTGNTSFGTGVVSGIVALMKSVNPNLCPAQYESILELSNQGLPTNASSFPQITQGVVDAEAAVIAAQSFGKYVITTPTIWNTPHEVTELSIEPGGQLTILNTTVTFGLNTSVIVKRNARLIVNNSTLEACGGSWSGIRVWGNSSKEQPAINAPLTDPDQCGIVILEVNTILKNARIGISTTAPGLPWPAAADYYGGLVHCDHVQFINCRKGVEFMQYPKPVFPSFTFKNKSKFSTVLFEETGDGVDNSEGVTIWDTDNISFDHCSFLNMDFEGIHTYDAGVKIIGSNQFEDNMTGVLSTATTTFGDKVEVLDGNDFTDNEVHIDATAVSQSGGLTISSNTFIGGNFGVWLEGPTRYTVNSNIFSSVRTGVVAKSTGTFNYQQLNKIGCNRFGQCRQGILFDGENREVGFVSNVFDGLQEDVIVQEGNETGAINENQGAFFDPAGNCFSSGTILDIKTIGNTVQFNYFHRGKQQTCDETPNNSGNYTAYLTNGEINNCERGQVPPGGKDDLIAKRLAVEELRVMLLEQPADSALAEQLRVAQNEQEEILKYLVDEAIELGDFLEAETLLLGENSAAAKYAVYGIRFKTGNFGGAQAMLNELPNESLDEIWFKSVQEINLMRVNYGPDFQLSPDQEQTLLDIALSESAVRGYAQGLLTFLTGRRFVRGFDNQERHESAERPEENKATTQLPFFTVMPNPADDQLVINLTNYKENEALTVVITDFLGQIIFNSKLVNQPSLSLSVGGWPIGSYFVTVRSSQQSAQQQKVIIQHR
jgi:Subtilase family/Secretion system C-terminal sorting domain/Right handed beta helix region